MIESPLDFHNRSKIDLFHSIVDGNELENAAANYLISKSNMIRHGLFEYTPDEYLFTNTSNEILKGTKKWGRGPFRRFTAEASEPSEYPWHSRMVDFGNGRKDPRKAHSDWPGILDSDSSVAYGSISPWSVSPYLAGSEFGDPAWARTLVDTWSPMKGRDGEITNHHKKHLEPSVRGLESHHKDSWAREPSHMGEIDGKGFEGGSPNELYEHHFNRWLSEVATPEQLKLSEFEQKQQHLATYKDVWTGKIRDPLDPHDTGKHTLGMLAYGHGLEWLTPTQRDDVIRHYAHNGLLGHEIKSSDDGNDSGVKMPHIPQPWFVRNWKGRMSDAAIHQIRGMGTAGNTLPSVHHTPEDVKENFRGRHINQALKDILVYDSDGDPGDILRPDTKEGEVAHGYWDIDPKTGRKIAWKHDPLHDEAEHIYDKGLSKTTDERFLSTGEKRRAGVIPLMDFIAQKDKGGRLLTGKAQEKYKQKIPRLTGDILQGGNRKLSTKHRKPNEYAIHQEELDEWHKQGIIDDEQYDRINERADSVGGDFNRRIQVTNHVAPFTSMYHFEGGDENSPRLTPYYRFKLMHHTVGGMNLHLNNPLTEMHKIWKPDDKEGEAYGLFTRPPRASEKKWFAMQVGPDSEYEKPSDYPSDIWPRQHDESGSLITEEAQAFHLGLGDEPREDMQGILGLISDQPTDTIDYGGHANFLSGGTQWPNFLATSEPHHHQMARDGTGKMSTKHDPNSIGNPTLKSRNGHYVTSSRSAGFAREKMYSLMNSLLFGWGVEPHIADDTKLGGGFREGENVSSRVNQWFKALESYGKSNPELIPGDPDVNWNDYDLSVNEMGRPNNPDDVKSYNEKLRSRISQFLMHIGVLGAGPTPAREAAMPLDEPRIAGSPTVTPDVEGIHEGMPLRQPGGETSDQESDEKFGWLDPDRYPEGAWGIHRSTVDLDDVNNFKGRHRRSNEIISYGKDTDGKEVKDNHFFNFDTQSEAEDALIEGEVKCPVCNGDGKIDPEDMGVRKSDKPSIFGNDAPDKPSIFGTTPSMELEVGTECPNCNGSGKHKLQNTGTIAMNNESHHKEKLLLNQIEQIDREEEMARSKGLSTADYSKERERLEDIIQYELPTPAIDNIAPEKKYSGFEHESWKYSKNKILSTANVVRDYASHLQQIVRDQFKNDNLPDPFGADEDGDWSQAHVNALQLWRFANQWALSAQPSALPQELKSGTMFGDNIISDGNVEESHETPFGSAIYDPNAKDIPGIQSEPMSMPMSIFNSSGYRFHHGRKMTPTFHVHFNSAGEPDIAHNNGDVSSERIPLLNAPFDHIQSVFPDMQPMSAIHPSAPSADDRPESQKTDELGNDYTFRHSKDKIVVSDLIKSLMNPDVIKEDGQFIPIKAAHRIFRLKDLSNLRGFSGDWVVSCWWKGQRAIVKKTDDDLTAQYADGSECKLSDESKNALWKSSDDNFVLDIIISKKKQIDVIDLLEHDDKELYNEPLKDRIRTMRTLFDSTEEVRFPAPFNTRRTDDVGLKQSIDDLDESCDGYLLRDADSTYMKGESRHPKWILYRKLKEIDAIIIGKDGKGPFTYRLGVGPINPEKGNLLDNRAIERDGKWFMDIGTLVRERKEFDEGDYVRVRISSVSHRSRKGEDIYTVQPTRIAGQSETNATDSVDTLSLLVKSYEPIPIPHDMNITRSEIHINIPSLDDTVIYKINEYDNKWAIHEPVSMLGDLSENDYVIHVSESLRPFWEPVAGITLKSHDDNTESGMHEEGFKVKKPKKIDDEQILKPSINKTILTALQIIDNLFVEKSVTWTGPKGLGIGLGTPDSAPRGPTEIESDQNTLDYDMRPRPDEEIERPREGKKPQGFAQNMTISLTTDDDEVGQLRVSEDEAIIEIQPK